ncbi:hypothetical protein [Neptuniibacter halophilus]|uniref:hypothetical protein n=1 Tax=Neptuniibacter halophilus TaxID=651666 RepID=UPI0025748A90|nr:hypothetical protein [Neptuniibacter halophilus]
MVNQRLEQIWQRASEAHAAIQNAYSEMEPRVGVSQSMRSQGIPADAMTIDNPKNQRRIILILHDQQPETISYQFAWMDKDPEGEFKTLPDQQLTTGLIYEWMEAYLIGH